MAKPRKTPAGKYELCIQHRLLPTRLYFTFDTEQLAIEYELEAKKWLQAGIVPPGLAAAATGQTQTNSESLLSIIRQWINAGTLSKTDTDILTWLSSEPLIKNTNLITMTYKWAESWVDDMKRRKNFAPSSIRQRVQAVSKAIDWYLRTHPQITGMNPLKLLPRGYSIYSPLDAKLLEAQGKEIKHDVQRDIRLDQGEIERVRAVLRGEVKPEGLQRAIELADGNALPMLFELILATGVRLREAYTLTVGQIDLGRRVLRIQTTKQRNGKIAFRDVPIKPTLFNLLSKHLAARSLNDTSLLFPFWGGESAELAKVSNKLSNRFRTVFDHAGLPKVVEHDLRHTATCEWFELRDRQGNWMFRPEEINVIMGWKPGSAMAARYASFRADSLADRLWA